MFGGSTDYEDYYSKHGSLLVGSTIDKYFYSSFRYRPHLLADESIATYSKIERVKDNYNFQHPLVREILKYYGIKRAIDLHLFGDIPSRTGLGGSSAFCASLIYIMCQIGGENISKKAIAKDAILLERKILNEAGGIQDQIWASYGGFNYIEINMDGSFIVKPMPISIEFKNELNQSMVLVYTNENQRTDLIAASHENKNKENIQKLAKEGYNAIVNEDIKSAGAILMESWNEKKRLSNLISTYQIDEIASQILRNGCYGVKLLGSGGSGFLLGIGNAAAIKKCKLQFTDKILDFNFEERGVENVFQSNDYSARY